MAIVSWKIMVKTDKNFVIAETHPTRTPRFLILQKKMIFMCNHVPDTATKRSPFYRVRKSVSELKLKLL